MVLPKEPFTLNGGCSCGAIRYRIAVPGWAERPVHYGFPAAAASDDTTPRMPIVCTDHCNDCRSATASVLPAWILTPKDMFSMSCLTREDETKGEDTGRLLFAEDAAIPRLALAARTPAAELGRPPYVSAYDLLSGRAPGHGTWLSRYLSTYDPDAAIKRIVRSFCGRCGTSIAYVPHPMPFDLFESVDVVLATIDREDLEKPWMQPAYQLWWDYGIPWIRDLVRDMGASKHPTYKLNETVE